MTEKGKIKKITCGGTHTLALTHNNEVYVWGYGNEGQLGLKNVKFAQTPYKLDFGGDRKVNKIYAGYEHSMAISVVHEIFVWGAGKSGQLGRILDKSDEPLAIDDLAGREVIKGYFYLNFSACGYDNCAAITIDGKLFVWGGNNSGKLGIDSKNQFESSPRDVSSLNGIKRVSLGMEHTAAINTNNELYTWGGGFFGQLGHGDNITKSQPKKVDYNDIKYEKVKCGNYQTVAVDKKGMVYVWGKGGYNLNQEPNKHKLFPEIIEDFKSVRAKSISVGYGNSLVVYMFIIILVDYRKRNFCIWR